MNRTMKTAEGKAWARARMPRIYRMLRATKRLVVYGGPSLRCSVCDHRMRRWRGLETNRWERICPWCESRGRQRLMWLWINRETDLLSGAKRLLHIAPEEGMRARFLVANNISYTTADLDPQFGDVAMDLCAAPWPDACFDAILCSHVLEHIPDDRRAMSELVRILRPGGWALLLVPFALNRETDEDPSATPEERLRRFGQEDHVRSYGREYIDRLRGAGFDVEYEKYARRLGAEMTRVHGLPVGEFLIVGRKPAAVVSH